MRALLLAFVLLPLLAPAAQQAPEIQTVTTIDELKQQPPLKVGEGTVRLGIDSKSVPLGAGVTLYALVEGDSLESIGERDLGPLQIDSGDLDQEAMKVVDSGSGNLHLQTAWVNAESVTLRLQDGAGITIAQVTVAGKKDELYHAWRTFSASDDNAEVLESQGLTYDLVYAGARAWPAIDGARGFTAAELGQSGRLPSIYRMLERPCRIPPEEADKDTAELLQRLGSDEYLIREAAMQALAKKDEAVAGALVLEAKRQYDAEVVLRLNKLLERWREDFQITWQDDRLLVDSPLLAVASAEDVGDMLLARWWINGKAAADTSPSPEPADPKLMAEQLACGLMYLKISLGPLKVGADDKVEVQLAYCPEGRTPQRQVERLELTKSQELPMQGLVLVSNRLELPAKALLKNTVDKASQQAWAK